MRSFFVHKSMALGGWMDEWMDGWADGWKSRVQDCLQQSKNLTQTLTRSKPIKLISLKDDAHLLYQTRQLTRQIENEPFKKRESWRQKREVNNYFCSRSRHAQQKKVCFVSSGRGLNLTTYQVSFMPDNINSHLTHDPEASKHVGKNFATSQLESKLLLSNRLPLGKRLTQPD